jgi:hypothetical protein
MADNFLYIPFENPVKFYEKTKEQLAKYFTKHFDDYRFIDRGYSFEQGNTWYRVWQTNDIIYLQFSSSFDPITLKLLDKYGIPINIEPAMLIIANKFIPGTFVYQVAFSLAALPTSFYYLQMEAGIGVNKKILISDCMYISSTPIANTIYHEYWNSRSKGDVLYETGIKFGARLYAYFERLQPVKKDEVYRNQQYSSALVSNKTARQWPVVYGGISGIADDEIDLIVRIWGVDNVMLDNKLFGVADESKFEFITLETYRKRGVKLIVEEGINRNSSIFAADTDTTKKLVWAAMVDKKLFFDTGNSSSSNTVPILTIE